MNQGSVIVSDNIVVIAIWAGEFISLLSSPWFIANLSSSIIAQILCVVENRLTGLTGWWTTNIGNHLVVVLSNLFWFCITFEVVLVGVSSG